jgi:hypothetical protein
VEAFRQMMNKCTKIIWSTMTLFLLVTPAVALEIEANDLNHTFSLIQFGITANKEPANSVYIRGIYATEEQCQAALLNAEYISNFKKHSITGKFFGVSESMHGISMFICSLNMQIDTQE